MNIGKVGRRGQISIPSAIRHDLNLHEGDYLVFINRGDEIVIQPIKQTLLDLRGIIPVAEPQDFATIRQQILSERAYRVEQNET